MNKTETIAPFLKWAGGKRQLIPSILALLPPAIEKAGYIEPFVGGGALFFYLQPLDAIINDFNPELMNVYRVIKERPEELIFDLKRHQNEPAYYYNLRALDRSPDFWRMGEVEKASRIIYLNKTCYNGLYRVNQAGEFNVPFGRYKNPNIVNEFTIRAVSAYLNTSRTRLMNTDFEEVLESANVNSFVYLDPPYHPLSPSANFTGYIRGGWNQDEQRRLKNACDRLDKRGIRFLLSNSATAFVRDLYRDYRVDTVKAIRALNSSADKRGEIEESLIRNYE